MDRCFVDDKLEKYRGIEGNSTCICVRYDTNVANEILTVHDYRKKKKKTIKLFRYYNRILFIYFYLSRGEA